MQQNKNGKPVIKNIIITVVLIACFSITTFALVSLNIAVKENTFSTGRIKININDGKSVINNDELHLEPGMTIKEDFFVENEGSVDAYYKLYLDNISGGLADAIEITIKDGNKILYSDIAKNLTKQSVEAIDEILGSGQKKDLTIYLHYPESEGNKTQNSDLVFTLCAEATQTKNNENKEF